MMLEHLSHTSIELWRTNRDHFYLTYMAPVRAPRPPQDKPAAVGSAFDALVKGALGGLDSVDLFIKQVEPHNREWATPAGQHVFDEFKQCGMLARMRDLLARSSALRFESKRKATIDGVPFVGYPDVYALLPGELHYVDDFKVKGYCSAYTTSPTKGYLHCVDGSGWPKPSRSNGKQHKDCIPRAVNQIEYNDVPLEACSVTYAQQLSIYGWLCGVPVGEQLLAGVHECVAQPGDARPLLRFAELRGFVSTEFQNQLHREALEIWRRVQAREIFDENNAARCAALDDAARHAADNPDQFAEIARGGRFNG